ncbi:MAG TPA: alcohol dehydrogenase catalytic domain-containing protein [Micromonosporaceae bacterium]|jgi:threonine dehydrogenase-like Zn-dependent dehydrogenase
MQALVFTAAGRVELREEPEPEVGADDVVVQIRASGICGSELHGFRTTTFRTPPLIMGHEFAGTTPDGTRVVVNPLLSCGTCASCAINRPQVCRSRQLLGVTRAGGFAERVSVPRSSLHRLPDDISWSAGALIEPLANAVHAWTRVPELPDQVAIIGAGPIGLACGLVARARGAAVTLFETAPARGRVAETLGFTTRESMSAGDEFEVVVDAVGSAGTRDASTRHTAPGGTAIWLGLASASAELAGNDLIRGERSIAGSFAYRPADFTAALELAGSLDLGWATDVPLAEAEETFYALAEGRNDIVKAVLVPPART